MLWDLLHFYSSLWASCTAAFSGVLLNVTQLNWLTVCLSFETVGKFLLYSFLYSEVYALL